MTALNYLRRYVKTGTAETEPEFVTPSVRSPIEELLPGHLTSGPDGACFITDTAMAPDHRHGAHQFAGLTALSASRLSLLCRDAELAYADLSGAVYLDTETTGLNMGTGTYVFLVGAGYFQEGRFVVRQFFLRSPGEEIPFLAALDEFLRGFSVLVTFNGKAFDWPLLESRFVGQRRFRRAPLDDPPHLDLLHPARRLWKRRLDSCALASLEQTILGVRRTEQDVPGWMIPSLYFDYLRNGDGHGLRRVFYHNLHDILSLAALTIHIDHLLADPFGGLVMDATDFFCLGKEYERAGDGEVAIACYEEALRGNLPPADRGETLMRLAGIYKRERRWDAALAIWDRLLDEGTDAMLHALIERAKYFEHVEREFLDALDDVQRAINLLELQGQDADPVAGSDLEHRRARLLNRVYRERSWAARRH